jgi:hypothetical protein
MNKEGSPVDELMPEKNRIEKSENHCSSETIDLTAGLKRMKF